MKSLNHRKNKRSLRLFLRLSHEFRGSQNYAIKNFHHAALTIPRLDSWTFSFPLSFELIVAAFECVGIALSLAFFKINIFMVKSKEHKYICCHSGFSFFGVPSPHVSSCISNGHTRREWIGSHAGKEENFVVIFKYFPPKMPTRVSSPADVN